jgi:hypothetical protein
MPVPATWEAEVLPRDSHPLEVLRGGEHLLDQLPVLRLDPGALGEGSVRLGDPLGQPVANRLQLPKVENPRGGGERLDAMRHLGATEGLAEEAGQLRLETADLAAQLQPRPSLVDPDPEPGEILSQQSGHQGKL